MHLPVARSEPDLEPSLRAHRRAKTPQPLELTEQQLEIISTGANNVPPSCLERCRSQIADTLMAFRRPISNSDVRLVAGAAHRLIADSPDLEPYD
jgi:hypothetical protein